MLHVRGEIAGQINSYEDDIALFLQQFLGRCAEAVAFFLGEVKAEEDPAQYHIEQYDDEHQKQQTQHRPATVPFKPG